jgi:hypothetical protein
VGEARALEVVDRGRIDAVVLAKDEAPQELGLRLGGPAAERRLGTVADAVHERLDAAASRPRQAEPIGGEDLADPVARQVASLP